MRKERADFLLRGDRRPLDSFSRDSGRVHQLGEIVIAEDVGKIFGGGRVGIDVVK